METGRKVCTFFVLKTKVWYWYNWPIPWNWVPRFLSYIIWWDIDGMWFIRWIYPGTFIQLQTVVDKVHFNVINVQYRIWLGFNRHFERHWPTRQDIIVASTGLKTRFIPVRFFLTKNWQKTVPKQTNRKRQIFEIDN